MSVADNLKEVLAEIKAVADEHNTQVQLVAVSKRKPIEMLREAFEAGQTLFGENYVQELLEKAPQLPDAQFRFIGHLQSNKAKAITACPNIVAVDTVDTLKLAQKLDAGCVAADRSLEVLIQVNTSGELSKSGVAPEEAEELYRAVSKACPRLSVKGFMTIGSPADSATETPEAFRVMRGLRELVGGDAELSMGMSADYKAAVRLGTSYVRVGSRIFGARDDKLA